MGPEAMDICQHMNSVCRGKLKRRNSIHITTGAVPVVRMCHSLSERNRLRL